MKENWKKNDNILIYSVKDVTQNKDYLIFLLKKRKFCVCWTIFHLKILQIYIEWKAKCMIKYTFHLLLCDIIEAIKITKRITKIKTKLPVFYAFLFFFSTLLWWWIVYWFVFNFILNTAFNFSYFIASWFDIKKQQKNHIKIINLNKKKNRAMDGWCSKINTPSFITPQKCTSYKYKSNQYIHPKWY